MRRRRGQMLEANHIAHIFLDPLCEECLEAEAILIERIFRLHLVEQLYWEKWKVKFLDEEEEETYQGFILRVDF